jgi:squalene monooxygenase
LKKIFPNKTELWVNCFSPGGVKKLHELGLADCLEGIDSAPVSGYAIFKEGKQIHVPYPEAVFLGRGFHNGRFVQQLRAKITNHPNITLFEGTAVNLLRNAEGKINGLIFLNASATTNWKLKPI